MTEEQKQRLKQLKLKQKINMKNKLKQCYKQNYENLKKKFKYNSQFFNIYEENTEKLYEKIVNITPFKDGYLIDKNKLKNIKIYKESDLYYNKIDIKNFIEENYFIVFSSFEPIIKCNIQDFLTI